jgi:chromosome segregation ATPase
MNKRPPAKKPQAKIQTVKKQIPIKKIAPDRIEELVKKHLRNIGEAENAFKSAAALLEKHKTKYPELEQYIENVSASDRSIQILEDIKDPRRAHYICGLPKGIESQHRTIESGSGEIRVSLGPMTSLGQLSKSP